MAACVCVAGVALCSCLPLVAPQHANTLTQHPRRQLKRQTTLACSKITYGADVLHRLESLETRREGIFVMPKERVTITATYWYVKGRPIALGSMLGGAAGGGSASPAAAVVGTGAHHLGGIGLGGADAPLEHTTGLGKTCDCDKMQDQLDHCKSRSDWQAEELQRVRAKCLPGR